MKTKLLIGLVQCRSDLSGNDRVFPAEQLPFCKRSPYLRRHRRWAIGGVTRPHDPDDPREFVGDGDGRLDVALAGRQLHRPRLQSG